MADIGKPQRIIRVEPEPATQPVKEPVPVKVPEKVRA